MNNLWMTYKSFSQFVYWIESVCASFGLSIALPWSVLPWVKVLSHESIFFAKSEYLNLKCYVLGHGMNYMLIHSTGCPVAYIGPLSELINLLLCTSCCWEFKFTFQIWAACWLPETEMRRQRIFRVNWLTMNIVWPFFLLFLWDILEPRQLPTLGQNL